MTNRIAFFIVTSAVTAGAVSTAYNLLHLASSGVMKSVGVDAGRGPGGSTLSAKNDTTTDSTVYVAFSASSGVLPENWTSFCTGSGLTCAFSLPAKATQKLPLNGNYLNATFSFDGPVGCATTKAEMNINNTAWYDVTDVSLLDGFSNKIKILASTPGSDAGVVQLGPPLGKEGNEKVFGLYPLNCDICVARQDPSCGASPGKSGCKSGTQFDPDIPCQWQGPIYGGGTEYEIVLVK